MNKKTEFLAKGGFYLLIGGLLIYAASRTLHFVQTLMPNDVLGYLFLLATGAGALIWLFVYLVYAKGVKQRTISFVMGPADLLAELALVYADTFYVGNQAGLVSMSPSELEFFITVSVIVIGINILAGYLFKLWDLNAEQEQQAQDLVDHVTEETMKHMKTPEAKQQMVQELLPVYKQSIADRVQAEIFARSSHTVGIGPRNNSGLNNHRYNLAIGDMPLEEWARIESDLAKKGYLEDSNIPHPTNLPDIDTRTQLERLAESTEQARIKAEKINQELKELLNQDEAPAPINPFRKADPGAG